jgi:hypothetical protein
MEALAAQSGSFTLKGTGLPLTQQPPTKLHEKSVRIQRDTLDQIYDVTARIPGYTLTRAAGEALDLWLQEAEAPEVRLPGGAIKKAGDPFPDPPNETRTGRPPRGGRGRGPVSVTTLYVSADVEHRFANAVAWTPGLYYSWAVEDALLMWCKIKGKE